MAIIAMTIDPIPKPAFEKDAHVSCNVDLPAI